MPNIALTEAEWKIMLRLWDHHPQTMMELTRSLHPETGWTKHTVITMLKRMQQKGTVLISEDGPVKTYSPAVEKSRVRILQPGRTQSLTWDSSLIACRRMPTTKNSTVRISKRLNR